MTDNENLSENDDFDVENPIFSGGRIDSSFLSDESSNLALKESDKYYESFADCNFDQKILDAIKKMGWDSPTPVQKMCLPYTLNNRNVAGFAQTGTGKTGVFLTTIAHKVFNLIQEAAPEEETLYPYAVVLAPTRELAIQIQEDGQQLLSALNIESTAIYGGVDYQKQAKQLKTGTHVIIATPGRLKDFTQKKIVDLSRCQVFVCDEVDRMFEMGFVEDVEFFLEKIPDQSQKLLFSATTSENVKELAFEYLDNPKYISVTPEEITPEAIQQRAIICDTRSKLFVLLGLLKEHNPNKSIIFTNTKLTAQWLQYKLQGNGFETDIITGDLPQRKRIRLMTKIKLGKTKILIATDVASRGLHVSGVTHVFNFDIPDDPSNYIHRIGRTARAGESGVSFSLVCDTYGENYKKVQTLLGESSPQSEWYDSKYLEIKDLAGNPFLDNFGVKSKEISHTTRKPGNKKPYHDDKKKFDKKPKVQSDGDTEQLKHNRPKKKKNQQYKNKEFNKELSTQGVIIPSTEVVVKEQVPSSFMGLVKKVYSLFLGKKK